MIDTSHLQCVTCCYKSPNESTTTFITRLIRTVDLLEDDIFYSLNKETKIWVNQSVVKILRRRYE